MTTTRRERAWRPRGTLAGQMLALQLAIMSVVLLGVAAVSIAQADSRFRETEGRRALSIAETLTSYSGIRGAADTAGQDPRLLSQARYDIVNGRNFSGSTRVMLALDDRRVIASSDGTPEGGAVSLQPADGFAGRSWIGTEAGTGSAMAMAPIINVRTLRTDGVVAVVREYPSVLDNLWLALPNLLTYLGIASAIGVVGSFLLARRIKRQTLGLEPPEIARLVEHREAILHGIREGVVAVDLRGRVTMINDGAAHLLGIPQAATGRHIDELDDSGVLAALDDTGDAVTDEVLSIHGRVVTVNRMPVISHGRRIGWVATLRDRTEMLELQRELDVTQSTTDTLRAQAHEFSNRMHVLSGMVALGEYDAVRNYITRIADEQTTLATGISQMVHDPAVAALLLAKLNQADERGVALTVEKSTSLPRLEHGLAVDVATVVGNLVDNAFDASGTAVDPQVTIELIEDGDRIIVTVSDSGSGVDDALRDAVFTQGFSTKADRSGTGRGVGLALVRLICRRRGGDVVVTNDSGAVFVATLPMTAQLAAVR